MTTVTIKNVGLSYGNAPALQDVSLVIPSGSLVAILGPSGCGKTSLLMALAGLVGINSGSITVGSRELSTASSRVPPEQRGVGWVPQEASLFPHLSVGDNIGFGLPAGRRRGDKVDELAELVGLAGFQDRSPTKLSGGQAQRVALARALAPSPDVLLLDEPFGALDTVLRHSLARDVAKVLRDGDITAVLVTHDREEALDLADLVVVMDAGHIVQVEHHWRSMNPPLLRGWRPLWVTPSSYLVCGEMTRWIVNSVGLKTSVGLPKTGWGVRVMWSARWVMLRQRREDMSPQLARRCAWWCVRNG